MLQRVILKFSYEFITLETQFSNAQFSELISTLLQLFAFVAHSCINSVQLDRSCNQEEVPELMRGTRTRREKKTERIRGLKEMCRFKEVMDG